MEKPFHFVVYLSNLVQKENSDIKVSNFNFQFNKKTKWHFGYTDSGCFCSKEKESQKDKQEEDTSKKINQNMAIVRSLDSNCNPQKQL